MKFISDLHLHTVASQHAYSTISEYAAYANTVGVELIGITDHGPAMLDAPRQYYFSNLRILPKTINGVRILRGAELNILDEKGSVDLIADIQRNLDYTIASYHLGVVPFQYTKEQFTSGYIGACDNDFVKIIGHPDNPVIPFDHESVLVKARETDTLLEMNNASYGYVRPGSYEEGLKLFSLAKKLGNYIIVNSDAHYHEDLLNFKNAMKLIKEIDFPSDRIVNTSKELMQRFFNV